MAIMLVPKSILHHCQGHLHSDHSHELSSQISPDNDFSYEAFDCEKCHYAFNALDLPEFSLIQISSTFSSIVRDPRYSAVYLCEKVNRKQRGPPAFVTI